MERVMLNMPDGTLTYDATDFVGWGSASTKFKYCY